MRPNTYLILMFDHYIELSTWHGEWIYRRSVMFDEITLM